MKQHFFWMWNDKSTLYQLLKSTGLSLKVAMTTCINFQFIINKCNNKTGKYLCSHLQFWFCEMFFCFKMCCMATLILVVSLEWITLNLHNCLHRNTGFWKQLTFYGDSKYVAWFGTGLSNLATLFGIVTTLDSTRLAGSLSSLIIPRYKMIITQAQEFSIMQDKNGVYDMIICSFVQ